MKNLYLYFLFNYFYIANVFEENIDINYDIKYENNGSKSELQSTENIKQSDKSKTNKKNHNWIIVFYILKIFCFCYGIIRIIFINNKNKFNNAPINNYISDIYSQDRKDLRNNNTEPNEEYIIQKQYKNSIDIINKFYDKIKNNSNINYYYIFTQNPIIINYYFILDPIKQYFNSILINIKSCKDTEKQFMFEKNFLNQIEIIITNFIFIDLYEKNNYDELKTIINNIFIVLQNISQPSHIRGQVSNIISIVKSNIENLKNFIENKKYNDFDLPLRIHDKFNINDHPLLSTNIDKELQFNDINIKIKNNHHNNQFSIEITIQNDFFGILMENFTEQNKNNKIYFKFIYEEEKKINIKDIDYESKFKILQEKLKEINTQDIQEKSIITNIIELFNIFFHKNIESIWQKNILQNILEKSFSINFLSLQQLEIKDVFSIILEKTYNIIHQSIL